MDENVRSRNKERREKYREFTKTQPIKTYNLYEGVGVGGDTSNVTGR